MLTKIVSKEFEVTTKPRYGKVFAKEGDKIKVSIRSAGYYNIHKVGDIPINSRWMRRAWVDGHCEQTAKTPNQ